MNALDRLIAGFAPVAALRRARARAALTAVMHYRASDLHRRSPSIRLASGDADTAAFGARRNLALIARDVVRNNPTAQRAVAVIVNNVIGTGIEPKLVTDSAPLRAAWAGMARLLDSTALDCDGVSTLAGLQRLALQTLVVDGESLVVWTQGDARGPQIRVLENDYLDDRQQGPVGSAGHLLFDGIERDRAGRVVAYHLFDEHPGSAVQGALTRSLTSTRVAAERVLHLYRVDRPGQRRGVSWLAPVLDDLVALADNDEAQLMRQKIAACFAAFLRTDSTEAEAGFPTELSPGLVQRIGSADEISFANPPDVTGYDDFARVHLRRVAVGLGITYESMTGDLSQVNFSSARLGRIDMAQNVDSWQWQLMIPRLCQPLGAWVLRQWAYGAFDATLLSAMATARLDWTPPPPVIADPKTETGVAVARIEAGLTSRPAEIRKMGYDPAELDPEITADMAMRRDLSALKAPAVSAATQATLEDSEEGTDNA